MGVFSFRKAASGRFFLYTVSMSWASKRRFIVFSILGAIVVALLASVAIAIFYDAPSCRDNKQNQDEEGIDCGGTSCTYLCSVGVQKPSTRFVRPFAPAAGRTDVIAYIDNPNMNAAAKGGHFTIELYGTDGTVLARKQGTVDLPPASTVPVYVPNFVSGYIEVARAFVSYDEPTFKWFRYTDNRIVPTYNNDAEVTGTQAPRITASLTNPSAKALRDVLVIATVFDSAGNAIAATQTVAPTIPAQGTATVVFIWNEPFSTLPARVDVVPIVPLPSP